jgi:hypothetical protein
MTIVNDNTLFIEVETGNYPVTFAMIRELKKANVSFRQNPPVEDIQQFGYEPVADSVIPTGDVVSEGAPALVDGVWTRTWIVRSLDLTEVAAKLTEARAALSQAVDTLRDNDLAYGLRYVFPDGLEGGVQMRNKDLSNLIGIRIEAEGYLAHGIDEESIEFRSLENITRVMKPSDIVKLTDACTAHTKKVYSRSWAIKDAIRDAATLADLPTLPATFV